jgi:hypothetical protein
MTSTAQIEELVREKMAGRKIDLVPVVDQFLMLARDVGEIKCTLASDDHLRFEIPGQDAVEVSLDCALGKLRTMCARLAVLCHESGQDLFLYGGEGIIRKDCTNHSVGSASNHEQRTWKVRFKNTTDQQEFTIQAE